MPKGFKKLPIVLLDRDGTINEEVEYLSDPKNLRLIPGAAEGIRLLNKAGFKVIVITNQSGLARGYFSKATLEAIHKKLQKELAFFRAHLDGIYFCPHHPRDKCSCRKPKTALVKRAFKEMALDPSALYVVGDKMLDMELAYNLRAKGILVLTGYGQKELEAYRNRAYIFHHVAKDLKEAAEWIISDYENTNR